MLMQFRPLITAVLLASAPAAFAAATDGSVPSRGNRALDQNGDGMISRAEATTAPRLAEKFDSIDADKNGALTREELAAWRKAHPRPSAGAPAEAVKP